MTDSEKFNRGRLPMETLMSEGFNRRLHSCLNSRGVYLGPAHLVTEKGSWFVPPSTDGAHLIVRGMDGILRGYFNVCRHREKQIMVPAADWSAGYTGKLPGGMITCSGHSWVYSDNGSHVISPAFQLHCDKTQDLHQVRVTEIGGTLWMGEDADLVSVREMLTLPLARECGISEFLPGNYRLSSIWVDHAPYTPVTGMEVYGDVTHVAGGSVHNRTLMQAVDPAGLLIDCSAPSGASSVQVVPWVSVASSMDADESWFEYSEQVKLWLDENGDDGSASRVVWHANYPDGWTFEEFPFMKVSSRFAPSLKGGTRNVVEFYFPDGVAEFAPQLAESAIAAYRKLAREDGQLCIEMDNGRRHLVAFGRGKDVGGIVHPHEEGIVNHYFTWLHREFS